VTSRTARTSRTGSDAPTGPDRAPTAQVILDAALVSFGTRGYDVTSLDALASSLGIRKQTILYWYPSKEALLAAVVDRSAAELTAAFEAALAMAGTGWSRIEAVVRSVFGLAAQRPELLGLVREVGRIGPPAASRLRNGVDPLVGRASDFLAAEMEAGSLRRHDVRFFLLSAYSVVIGVATEVEVLRALGMEPTPRGLVERRRALLQFLHSALAPVQ
jgi:TetR/AcrR family transcriptional regulator